MRLEIILSFLTFWPIDASYVSSKSIMHFAWDIMLWWFGLYLKTILAMLWWFGQPSHMVCLKGTELLKIVSGDPEKGWKSVSFSYIIRQCLLDIFQFSIKWKKKKLIERVCSWVQCTRAWLHASFCREQQQITSLCHQRKEDKGGQGCIKHATLPCETQSRSLLYSW